MPKPQLRQERQATAVLEKPAASYWPDDRLVRDCVAGKEEAWTALLDKYKNLIFSIPLKHGLSREDAAEIFQAVCAELLSELPKLRDPQALPGWLIKVTSHKCFHLHRQERRWDTSESVDEAGTSLEALAENLLKNSWKFYQVCGPKVKPDFGLGRRIRLSLNNLKRVPRPAKRQCGASRAISCEIQQLSRLCVLIRAATSQTATIRYPGRRGSTGST